MSVFLAIDVGAAMRARVGVLLEALRGPDRSVLTADKVHLTLVFLRQP